MNGIFTMADFFVLELSKFGEIWFQFPTGVAYVASYVGFVPSKNM